MPVSSEGLKAGKHRDPVLQSSRPVNTTCHHDVDDSDESPVQRVENRFAHYLSDEEDGKRVVKSAKDKRYEEMQSIIKNLNNHKKIRDMSNVLVDFESLTRVHEKSIKMNEIDSVPAFYIRSIAELEDFVNDSWEKKKDLNRAAAKALTALRQRVKKYNRDFEESIKDFREHPENYQEDEPSKESDGEDKSDTEVPHTKVTASAASEKKSAKKAAGSDSESDDLDDEGEDNDEDEEDSDDFWDSDSSSSSSVDVDMERFKDDPSVFFLKKTTDEKKDKTKVKKAAKERSLKKTTKMASLYEDEGVWTTVVDALGRAEPPVQAFEKGQEITHEIVVKKLNEILASRGKKGASTTEQLALLHQVEDKIKECRLSIGLHVKVLFSLISVFFDYDKSNLVCMSSVLFDRLLSAFDRLFDQLEQHDVDLSILDINSDTPESLETAPFAVRGSVLASATLLDAECTKVLQNANGHELEYVDRLKDERRVCSVLDRLCQYLERTNAPSSDMCAAYLLKVEHLYYKFDFDWAKRVEAEGIEVVGENAATGVIERLSHETDLRWRPISKPFHLALRVHDRAILVGPPETPRDHVLAAAKAMRYGNWRACTQYIINPKMDAKIWDLLFQSGRVKKLLETKIKEESLRSFLFTYSAIHDSISLDRLASYFEMPKASVYSTVSKMIINQELAASLEVPSNFLIMHKTERSRLQTLALQLGDKINSIVEMNEKLIESRTGGGGGGGLMGSKGSQPYQGPRRQALRYVVNKFN
ncbi:unnamed protein product [Dicrocoelium dendriticum]|nr:unnamed protein product [Dicrocoelium dendriticum]